MRTEMTPNPKMKAPIIVNTILSSLTFRTGMMSKTGCLGGTEALMGGEGGVC